jgi:hypothetical protein
MHSSSKPFIVSALFAALSGCSHEGAGSGTLEKPIPNTTSGSEATGRMEFSWRSGPDSSQGEIAAVSTDGRTFNGSFLQPTNTVTASDYVPYWNAWTSASWGAARPWYDGPEDEFIRAYGGRALARLTGDDGTRMRCTFVLRNPVSGMAGGGEGDCQLSTNEKVFHAVLREH